MNLFELINNFWRLDEQLNFTGNETRLYFFLLHVANRSRWPEWIEYADKRLAANANISLQVLKSARGQLKEAGLLNYVPGGGFRVKTKYQILTPRYALRSDPRLTPYNINTKDKNINTKTNGKGKGFVHTGSDFD
ncbi:hypothetical protein SAMN05444285_11555 [Draconibacterium orientale]|jgi:hypothetical protein|uniref:Helix-turn-helix domain-containing protein n=1 Tax=Draconibacterium orientale TaxID=1168034 RepID=X5E244_9BACT|nr:hypothetical protein [Draconibacterium orientale]AHW61535.1 hypothetical protein FH5T_03415 [Draconibacterium orientale]SET52307.1 hypothetical protein SAMN05444285_11555 [Draconibacterium orientale]